MAYKQKSRTFRKRESKEEFAARKKAEREAAYEMIDESISKIMGSTDSFKSYLDFQAHMDRYPSSNALLIMAQCPNATQLKSAEVWNGLGVLINSGEKPIHILKPKEFTDDNGEKRTSFNTVYVFDISQTNAEPQPATPLESNPKKLVKAMVNSTPLERVAVDELPIEHSTVFYDNEANRLLILRKSDGVQLFKDMTRELSLYEIAKGSDEYKRDECIPSAICASYMLSKKYGVDYGDINLNEITKAWSGMENKDIRTMLTMASDSLYSIGKDVFVELNKMKEKAAKEDPGR